MGVENISSCNVDTSNKITEINTRKTPESSCKIGCDLSLRSGPLFVTPMSVGNSKPQEVEDIGFGSSRVGRKHSDQSPVDESLLSLMEEMRMAPVQMNGVLRINV